MSINLRFLGVGSAFQEGLGHASAVVETFSQALHAPLTLLIDCGPGTLKSFKARYKKLPDAAFITHCHLDHIADFEYFFIQAWFVEPREEKIKLFIPATIIPLIQQRIGSYPEVLAEGGVNFWDAFQVIPVDNYFYWQQLRFNVHEVRHHAPRSAYGLHLSGKFFYTGDTRPIPELIQSEMNQGEIIFHDCGVQGNPSHTGIDDLNREYRESDIARMIFYHYLTQEQQQVFVERGLRPAKVDEVFEF